MLGATSNVVVGAFFVDNLPVSTPTPTPTATPTPAPPNSTPTQTVTTLPTSTNLSRVRLAPVNQTGGTSLYSRNFGWGTGLAGLSGRGLDAGFGISYNSLMWIRKGNEMIFNPNNDNVSPGFRFGFPVIEPSYSDPVTNKNTYLMVTPSGARVEFRQVVGSTDTFETADSSYVQLKVLDANNLQLTGTDGTNAFYQLQNGAFRCSQIKDANGNFITINHDTNGFLQTVTDTLNRVLTVNYDNQGSPVSVTQNRSAGAFTFATLSYVNLTISTNFSGLNLVGITNGATIKVLDKITYADGSFTQFEYNNYGQVWRINNHAADNHKLNHAAVNLDNGSLSAAQTDVPRFTQLKNWAENFNLNASNVAQEVVIPIVYQENAGFVLPDNSTVSGTLLHVTAPDGTISKTFVGGTGAGWMEAMPILSEDWASENNNWSRKRWSYSAYTQDDTNLAYQLNPRMIESKVGDSNNVRRSTMSYLTQQGNPNAAYFGLVAEVKVYDANQTTILKRSVTEYNLSNEYLARRIIGLPSKSELFDQSNALMAKVTYAYDEGNFSESGQNITAINHDSTNYGANFIIGRGNATSSSKWDVTDANNASKAITSRVKYNITGNPVASLDPLNREIKTSYADNFEDGNNARNTFAFPTQITDPANNSSTVKYRFDTGANVYAQSPAPAGQTEGKKTQRFYDGLGRLEKEVVLNTGAYTRYEYPNNGIQSKVFSTITDVNNNGADTNDEVVSESFSDGAGRTRMTRSEHPNSAGGWSATITEYDIMGRVKRSTVPTEVNNSWTPSGDDATRGWLWSSQEYDWKGRVVRQINTDGTDKLISYEGCGCAGGQVTTVQGELVPRDDNPSLNARRTQKVYEDILGRSYKSETLNWNGTVYSTSKSFFNGRDQVTLQRQFAGADSSSTFQDTVMTFDGYGRLKTQKRPEQDANTATVYNYFADDRIQQVVDARGATINYVYDVRGLTTQVSTTSPNPSIIPVTPTVNYSYDNLGNRTQMTDGTGSTNYSYDQLSRIVSETKQFTELTQALTLQYEYSFSGQVKKIDILPNNTSVSYNFDKANRVTSIAGTGFTNTVGNSTITNIVSNISYRAWNSYKTISNGNNVTTSFGYDNNLKVSSFQIPDLMNLNYQYNADGKVKFVDDLRNPKFDRGYTFDQKGRLTVSTTAEDASGLPRSGAPPYAQWVSYDNFDNVNSRTSDHWTASYMSGQAIFVNNRRTGWTYNADGDAVNFDGNVSTYDTAGQQIKLQNKVQNSCPDTPTAYTCSQYKVETTMNFDGDGQEVIKNNIRTQDYFYLWNTSRKQEEKTSKEFSLKSTVLGGFVVFTITQNSNFTYPSNSSSGTHTETRIFNEGRLMAKMETLNATSSTTNQFTWSHVDPMSTIVAESNSGAKWVKEMLDPNGSPVGFENPYPEEPEPQKEPRIWDESGNGEMGFGEMVEVDGVLMNRGQADRLSSAGATSQCPRQGCGAQMTKDGWAFWTAFADGYAGYMPMGANYRGSGNWTFQQDDKNKKKKQKPVLIRKEKQQKPKYLPQIDPKTETQNVDPPDWKNGNFVDNFLQGLNLLALMQNKVHIIGFTNEQEEKIVNSLVNLFVNKDCADAFKRAKGPDGKPLPTPAEVARDRGTVIVSFNGLTKNAVELYAAGIDTAARMGLIKGASNFFGKSDAYTPDPYVGNGLNYPAITVLFDSNWEPNGGKFPFNEVMPHEALHRSGVRDNYKWYQTPLPFIGHDLTGYESYEDILKNCSN